MKISAAATLTIFSITLSPYLNTTAPDSYIPETIKTLKENNFIKRKLNKLNKKSKVKKKSKFWNKKA